MDKRTPSFKQSERAEYAPTTFAKRDTQGEPAKLRIHIRTEADYLEALQEVSALINIDSEIDSVDGNRLDVLGRHLDRVRKNRRRDEWNGLL
jgi:hypothetical protein